MIFQNPWAWIGLIAIASPIVAHLLARRPARRLAFPQLRFLPATTLRPIRRARLADIGLLVLRCAILATAVAALAQPWWLSADRARDLGAQIARAIIIDTSASMQRTAAGGGGAIDAARREARAREADATRARTGETAAPAASVAGAAAWLATQPMRRELVVISDFQPTALARADVDAVPADIGVRLVAIPIDRGAPGPSGPGAPPTDAAADSVQLLAGPAERAAAAAARAAAIASGAPPVGQPDRPVAIVFSQFETRSALLQASRPIDEGWMFEIVMAVTTDAAVQAAARRAGHPATDIVTAARGRVDDADRLLLFTTTPAGSLLSAAIIQAVLRASANEPAVSEQATETRTADELRAWERPPAAVPPSGSQPVGDRSDSRWWWMAVIALLAFEWWMRRRPRALPRETETPHARVA